MDRLTFDGNFCDIARCAETPGGSFCEDGSCSQKKVWERLKAYEDTRLDPEQVKSIWTAICDTDGVPQVPWGRLSALARADKEGRVVVVPVKVSDVVFVDKKTLPYNYLHPLDGCKNFAVAEIVSVVVTRKETYLKLRFLYRSRAGKRGYLRYGTCAIGKTVFLSAEDAAEALKAGADNG